jgi:hypothetical protein
MHVLYLYRTGPSFYDAHAPCRTANRRTVRAYAESLRERQMCGEHLGDAFRGPRIVYYLGLLTLCLTTVRPIASLPLSDFLFFGALLMTIIESAVRNRITFRLPLLLSVGLFLSLIGGFLSSMAASHAGESFSLLLRYFYLLGVWFWLGTVVLREPSHVMTALCFWVASACITGLGALAQFIFGDVIPGTSPMGLRMTGFTGHVNDLGGATCVAIVPALMLATRYAGRWVFKMGAWFAVGGILIGLILSVSISGIGAAVVGTAVWRQLRGSWRSNLLILFLMIIVTAAALIIFGDELYLLQRFSTLSEPGSNLNTVTSRVDTYLSALDEIGTNPLVGVGLGQATRTGWVVHNLFLLQWYESGVFAFVGIAMIVAVVLWAGLYLTTRAVRVWPTFHLAPTLLASFVAFIVLGMGQPVYFNRFGWVSAALLMALWAIESRIQSESRHEQSTVTASVQ